MDRGGYMRRNLDERLLIFLFLLSVFILSIIKIEDTDTWMHLSLGRLIWESRGIPAKEVFVYTATEMPFSYSSWLFGLIYFLTYKFFNIYGVILLKALIVTATFYIILKDSLLPHKNYVIAIVVISISIFFMRERFVERPDMVAFMAIAFTIYSLNAFILWDKKYIYVLPVVHLLWANMHSSINLMVIIFSSFISGGIVMMLIERKGTIKFLMTPSPQKLKIMIFIAIGSFIFSLLNPNFINQYFFAAQFLGKYTWYKQQIVELAKPTWGSFKYPYIISSVVLLSFIIDFILAFRKRLKKNSDNSPVMPSLSHLFLIVPFIFLSFTAVRFIFPLVVIATPVLVRNISLPFNTIKITNSGIKKIVYVCLVIWILTYPVLLLGGIINGLASENKRFGFGINYETVPEGALRYMDEKGITGRIFNLFQWGGYIVWRDFPKRSVFIDPRGYVPADLIEKQDLALGRKSVMTELEKRYGFDIALLTYRMDFGDQSLLLEHDDYVDVLLSNPEWAPVYWDDVSILYLRRGGRYDSVISEDEYKFIKPANGIKWHKRKIYSETTRTGMINELIRNIKQTHSDVAKFYLGFIFNESGFFKDAINIFEGLADSSYVPKIYLYDELAYAYLSLSNRVKAMEFYKKALSYNEDPNILYKLGILSIEMNREDEAMKYLRSAIEANPNLISAYPFLLQLYQKNGLRTEAERIKGRYETLLNLSKGEEHFKKGLNAYFTGDFMKAIEEFQLSAKINPGNPLPFSNIGYAYYDMGNLEKAYEYHKRALEIDPNTAVSHYGLALIYKMQGQKDAAIRHFEKYIEIEPLGYYSRKAASEIETLRKGN